MERLGSYILTGHLTSQNSGYSVWGFGKKQGQDFFIKQFLSPKYPENDSASSPERLERKRRQCRRFEERKAAVYRMLNENSDGNAVRVTEFFRVESKYYITMQKIEALPWTVETIVSLSEQEKRFLCSIIAHGIAGLHKGHVVHADLKHDNILYTRTAGGYITAKIIDFDSGFLESDPPRDGEEIVGDQAYFSPEACMTFWGATPELTCKMDIFALGVLFHQYFAGSLPIFDTTQNTCAGEAAAKGQPVTAAPTLQEPLRCLLQQMLDPNPARRPTAMEVYNRLIQAEAPVQPEPEPEPVVEMPAPPESAAPTPQPLASGFFKPGDL